MKKIMIATPTIDGKCDIRYILSLKETILLGLNLGIEVYPIFIPYDSLITKARNDLFHIAYESKVDCMFFIDADMGWISQDFFRVVLNQEHVIGGIARKKSDEELNFNVRCIFKEDKPLLDIREDNLIEVLGIGTGFLKVDKYAIEKIWGYSKKYIDNGIEKAFVFYHDIDNETNEQLSEDIVFCKNWTGKGNKIYIDKDIYLDHIGIKNFPTKFSNYLSQFDKA